MAKIIHVYLVSDAELELSFDILSLTNPPKSLDRLKKEKISKVRHKETKMESNEQSRRSQ